MLLSKLFSRQVFWGRLIPIICLVLFNLNASWLNNPNNRFAFCAGIELGFVKVLSHKIQFSQDGTRFDYVKEGGQDILFPFNRLTAELAMGHRHTLIFLIQPLEIRTEARLERDVVVDELTFPNGTPMDLKYGFSFYRLSYQYDFNRSPEKEIALGLSLQLRNASIIFASKDGRLLRINQNVGPVPIIRFRGWFSLNQVAWLGAEIDGFYASGRIITGSKNDFIGAILDGSLRYGIQINESLTGFLNFRYLGGKARGTEENHTGPGDGYTDNWLHTTSITLGFYLK
uniref:Uncharacterized protein n=1 Tax=candidate division WOR-3 bacterium TaxID=2052148 RepID=A0A7C6AA90_UNCW3